MYESELDCLIDIYNSLSIISFDLRILICILSFILCSLLILKVFGR